MLIVAQSVCFAGILRETPPGQGDILTHQSPVNTNITEKDKTSGHINEKEKKGIRIVRWFFFFNLRMVRLSGNAKNFIKFLITQNFEKPYLISEVKHS